MKIFLFSILLPLIISTPQINLYFTDQVNENDCLRIIVSTHQSKIDRQIISYCITESLSKYIIKKDNNFSKFTFSELFKQNITSQQLYLWSAPIDLIEDYQFYLNQLETSNSSLLERKIFYNCTLPRFGLICEYELNNYNRNYSSLYHIIHNFYNLNSYKPFNMTCYIHLQCNRGPYPSCLDWSEICDGKIDCFNNKIDEENCWQLEINECQENEFRCMNGQCIPKLFYLDDLITPDCLDQSDEYNIYSYKRFDCQNNQPLFGCEDIICINSPLTSSCVEQRDNLLINSLYSIKDKSISDDCWLAFKKLLNPPYTDNSICYDICKDDINVDIINKTCPNLVLIPSIPVLFHDLYFAYTKNDSQESNCTTLLFPYICYKYSYYDEFFINYSKLIFNNLTCYRIENDNKPKSECIKFSWLEHYLKPTYISLKKYIFISNFNRTIICNRLNMYQCINSLKCISIHRLMNGINDCPYQDDEDIKKILNIHAIEYIKKNSFKCQQTNKYIPKQFIIDGKCDCGYNKIFDWCEDEDLDMNYIKRYISFQTICDSFIELLPIIINDKNETDETECDKWSCNNIDTHCDGQWNCPNGEDEINCYSFSSLKCSSNEHFCVSLDTYQLICLPIIKANDGYIDCIGATDEPFICFRDQTINYFENFYCIKNNLTICLSSLDLCDGIKDCDNGDDEKFCNQNRSLIKYESVCITYHKSIRLDVEQFLCEIFNYKPKKQIAYFSLDSINNLIDDQINNIIDNSNISNLLWIENYEEQDLYCHRGFKLRLWLDNKNNLTKIICFCPPSFYGSQCQYQNQRISLSLQFRTFPNSWQTIFDIIVSLIDANDKTIIHSYEKFTYLSIRDCEIKFNLYLLYSTIPKDSNKNYTINIDIYEKITLNYRGNLLFPIMFPFLPVHRLAFIVDIPRDNINIIDCSKEPCYHGKCIKHFNNRSDSSFCLCNQGWSGRYCNIPYDCTCSSNSLCIGITTKNQSICVCSLHQFGPRCFLTNTICSINETSPCKNNGECIPNDEHIESDEKYTCICPKGYMGKRCELIENKLILSFDKEIILPQSIFIHFIQVIKYDRPLRVTTFQTIPFKSNTIIIHWLKPFHLVFIEFPNKKYYLTIFQKKYNQSINIIKKINQYDRCRHINEIFNQTIIDLHLLRRIKYYHLPCQIYSYDLFCFYDDIHLCICQNHEKKRLSNCFEFNHNMTFNCWGQSLCENNAYCFQDSPKCSKRSICICRPCFYGLLCQFSTNGFGLSLDGILGYHIQSNINIIQQPYIVKISIIFTIILTIIGFINGICTFITFKRKTIRQVGCVIYLLTSSITTLLSIIMFNFKFWILILAQMGIIMNYSFLSIQCHLIDFFLRCFLNMDQWLNACVAIERAVTTIQSTRFNKRKSKQIAKIVIIILFIIIIGTNIHDPIYRRLINEENEDEKRIWCIISYTSNLQIYNSVINIIHFITPFIFNLISVIIIFTKKTRQQLNVQTNTTYKYIFLKYIRQHKHLFLAPIVLIILAVPRLVISLATKCMKSANDSWLYLIGYFISFIPLTLSFIIFILPSKFYLKEYYKTIIPYRRNIQEYIYSISANIRNLRQNRIRPI